MSFWLSRSKNHWIEWTSSANPWTILMLSIPSRCTLPKSPVPHCSKFRALFFSLGRLALRAWIDPHKFLPQWCSPFCRKYATHLLCTSPGQHITAWFGNDADACLVHVVHSRSGAKLYSWNKPRRMFKKVVHRSFVESVCFSSRRVFGLPRGNHHVPL